METLRKEIFMEERTLPRYPAGKRELIFYRRLAARKVER